MMLIHADGFDESLIVTEINPEDILCLLLTHCSALVDVCSFMSAPQIFCLSLSL